MTVSTSFTYTQAKDELIKDSFRLISAYGDGLTISSADMSFATSMLNKMLKAWAVKGPHLWSTVEGILFLDQYQSTYAIGPNSTQHAALASDVIMTQLNGAVSSGVSTIVVDSTAGMVANDKIGIVLTDNSLFWTTINTVNSATSLLLNSTLTGAASDNNYVFTYTNSLTKPLKLNRYPRFVGGYDNGATSTQVEIPFELVPYENYMNIPVKTYNSQYINQACYKPGTTDGTFYVFPRPSNCSYRVQFTFAHDLADMLINTNNFDLPHEWYECITYQLAIRLARPFGRAAALVDLAPMASQMLKDLIEWDQENMYLDVRPDDAT